MPSGDPAVVWATLPGFFAQAVMLEDRVTAAVMTLVRGDPIRVSVLDGEGHPIAGVKIVHALAGAEYPERGPQEAMSSDAQVAADLTPFSGQASEEARIHFRREVITDERGRATVAAGRGINLIQAVETGAWGRISRQMRAVTKDSLTLELTSVVQIEGRVFLPDGSVHDGDTTPIGEVVVGFMDRARIREAGRCQIRADGTFGRVSLPITAEGELIAWVEVSGLAQEELRKPAPDHGDLIRLEFSPGAAMHLNVLVLDEGQAPITGAMLDCRWRLGHRQGQERAFTDSEGKGALTTLGQVEFRLTVSKPGYAAVSLVQYGNDDPASAPEVIVLLPGSTLSGRVVHRGEPVTDFYLCYFKGDPYAAVTREMHDPEGRFSIADAPSGNIVVYASADHLPQSKSLELDLDPGSTRDILLELPDPLPAKGLVLDTSTALPISGALIQLYTAYSTKNVSAREAFAYTDEQGGFELMGIGPKLTGIRVTHAGYSTLNDQIRADPARLTDLGTLTLSPLGTIAVDVLRRGGSPANLMVYIAGTNAPPGAQVPPDGKLVFPDSSAGHAWITVVDEKESWDRTELLLLDSDRDHWSLDFDLTWARTIEVTVRGDLDLNSTYCSDYFLDPSGRRVRDGSGWVESEGVVTATLPYLPDVTLVVEVRDFKGQAIVGKRVVPDGSTYQRVELVIDGDPWRLRVVDTEGLPLPGVKAEFALVTPGTTWTSVLFTDTDGMVKVGRMDQATLRVSLTHPEEGAQYGTLVHFPENGKTVEVVFDPSHELRLRLMDGEYPIESAKVSVGHPEVMAQMIFRMTDKDGRLHWTHLGHQDLRLVIWRFGIWPSKPILRDVQDGREYTVQVRRVGGVKMRVMTVDGVSLPDTAVDLVNEEFGESVADWLAEGKITLDGDLVTDHAGRLTVTGVPNGNYTWTVGEVSGTLRVPPGTTGSETLFIP